MIQNILDGICFLFVCGFIYLGLVFGTVWENEVRCENGYVELCK